MENLAVFAGTVLGVAGIMVARDIRDGKSVFRRNGTYESNALLRQMLEEMQKVGGSQTELKAHYNDDTTRLLEEILDSVRRTHSKLDEWDRYGVKTRVTP